MAKDRYHNTVKTALTKDGWTITHDPFMLSYAKRDVYADLGAEKFITAEKDIRKIVVEVKSFTGHSIVRDLEQAVGQYLTYLRMMQKNVIDRTLYLAIPSTAYKEIFQEDLGELFLEDGLVQLIVFDEQQEAIDQWIPN